MGSLNTIKDKLEAIRAHKGTVRVMLDNHALDAEVLSVSIETNFVFQHKFVYASLRICGDAKELVQFQQSIIRLLLNGNHAAVELLSPKRLEWVIAETHEVITNERGQFLWTVQMSYSEPYYE